MRAQKSQQSSGKGNKNNAGSETLSDISRDAVKKVVRRVNGRRAHASGLEACDGSLQRCSSAASESGWKRDGKQVVDKRVTWNDLDSRTTNVDQEGNDLRKIDGGNWDRGMEMDDVDWEDGNTNVLCDSNNNQEVGALGNITIEFTDSPESAKRRPVRRATAEEKELAELVHKVHLLCLLSRGRIIDCACDDPLIQASLLSLLPTHLMKISEISNLTAGSLSPLVSWFHNNFHVRSISRENSTFKSALAFALETREGTPEEITALCVALFRALKLTTRFVSILDVASIKPDSDQYENSSQRAGRIQMGIFNSSTLMVDRAKDDLHSPAKLSIYNEKKEVCETSSKVATMRNDTLSGSKKKGSDLSPDTVGPENQTDSLASEAHDNSNEKDISKKLHGSKRKGDIEFEMQLQMALSATVAATPQSNLVLDSKSLNGGSSVNSSSPFKRLRTCSEESSSQGMSVALGSKKIGSPLFWAEVYCSGDSLTGKWVHVDAINAIVDGEEKVEAAAAACKTSLRYVVAFAGSGAKDVTRRYCMKWYKIASQRINANWWDAVLMPLRELESGATGGAVVLEKHNEAAKFECEKVNTDGDASSLEVPSDTRSNGSGEFSGRKSYVASRNSLEDMELETRGLTEPLPTNQQAYKNHHLYAIEKWLTRCQVLHPKGPVLGFCSGHPVYPRACVQKLKTKHKWLCEGLQVKTNEVPVKVLKQSANLKKVQFSEENNIIEADSTGNTELYGKWQLESLKLPCAVNGIVPKNERGQVDVWSEKCLPPGTVHLRLPRVFHVAKRLEIDYAPAMVGFEFRNGRCVPVFDGIVVCTEFKDIIQAAYAEEVAKREAEEQKRNEAQALSRWYQLLSSIITRQRLKNRYGDSSQTPNNIQSSQKEEKRVGSQEDTDSPDPQSEDTSANKWKCTLVELAEDHEHVFLTEDQSFDENSSIRTKRCRCGFSIQVEEL